MGLRRNGLRDFYGAVYTYVRWRTIPKEMAVLLRDIPPPISDVANIGRECISIYALMWESAAKDQRGDCGGICTWTVKGLAAKCGMSKTTVIAALKKLLDSGFIQYAESSSPRARQWRVTHPQHLEAVRYTIDVMGLPSLKYNDSITKKNDKAELVESESGEKRSEAS